MDLMESLIAAVEQEKQKIQHEHDLSCPKYELFTLFNGWGGLVTKLIETPLDMC